MVFEKKILAPRENCCSCNFTKSIFVCGKTSCSRTVLDVCIELETVNEFWKCFSVVAVGQFLLLFGVDFGESFSGLPPPPPPSSSYRAELAFSHCNLFRALADPHSHQHTIKQKENSVKKKLRIKNFIALLASLYFPRDGVNAKVVRKISKTPLNY